MTSSSTQRYLVVAVMLHWLALNLSEAPSFRSPHVSLSTWGSRPASLSQSLRRSRLTTLPPLLLRCCRWLLIMNGMRLESVRKRGYHVSTNGIGTGMLTWPADDWILLLSTIADDPKPEQVRDLAGSGPQLACERWKEGSPGALDAGRRHRGFDFVQVRPG